MVVKEFINKIGWRFNETEFRNVESRVRAFQGRLRNFGTKATMFVTAPFVGLNIWMAKTLSNFEQMDTSFRVMIGNVNEAKNLTQEMLQFAAKTPFQVKNIGEVSKQLLATGTETKNLIEELTFLGNASAGLGVPMWRLALNFGQVRAQGKLTGRELRDFTVAGINVREELEKIVGKDKDIAKMVSKGQVSFDMLRQVFVNMSSEGGKFHNLMIEQSKTLGGMWSNFLDLMVLTVRDYQNELLPVFKSIVMFLLKILEKFKNLSPTLKRTIYLLTALTAIVGPLILTLTALMKVGLFVRGALLGIAAGARVANLSVSMFLLKLAFMGAAVVASIGLAILMFEDITMFFKGEDSLLGKFIEKLTKLNEKLKSLGINTLDSLISMIKSASTVMQSFIDIIVGIFMGKWSFALQSVKDLFVNTFQFIGDFINTVLQPIKDVVGLVNSKFDVSGKISSVASTVGSNVGMGAMMETSPGMGASTNFNTNINLELPNNPTAEQKEAISVDVENIVNETIRKASNSLLTAIPEVE